MPVFIYAQNEEKGPVIIIDLGKKNKNTEENTDSTKSNNKKPKEDKVYMREDEKLQPTEEKKPAQQEDPVDFKKGLFKANFIAGVNLCQVDGDGMYGYNQIGAVAGIGAMVKFHRNMSVSMELLYSMKGARSRISAAATGQSIADYRIAWDYIEIPLLFNVHDKKLFMFTVGPSFGAMIRYKEQLNGIDVRDSSGYGGSPKKIDIGVTAGFQFLIKQRFGIGARFTYSVMGIRPARTAETRVSRQYNNVIAIRFMYILDAVKKK